MALKTERNEHVATAVAVPDEPQVEPAAPLTPEETAFRDDCAKAALAGVLPAYLTQMQVTGQIDLDRIVGVCNAVGDAMVKAKQSFEAGVKAQAEARKRPRRSDD